MTEISEGVRHTPGPDIAAIRAELAKRAEGYLAKSNDRRRKEYQRKSSAFLYYGVGEAIDVIDAAIARAKALPPTGAE